MKKELLLIFTVLAISCSSHIQFDNTSGPQIIYHIDVSDHSDDLFHVTVHTRGLSSNNNIYNFVSTAPGTYSILDFGRLVNSFSAYDDNGDELSVEKISTNKWKIEHPEKLVKIEYYIEDSFDAEITDNLITPMCGTGIEENFIVLNIFGVLGYFEQLQSLPVKLSVDYNTDWKLGTALQNDSTGYYYAESFDHLADSPIFMGELTFSSTRVNDIDVNVYVYTGDTSKSASKLLAIADDMLQSSSNFIGYSPVSHYDFLICLINQETMSRNNFYGTGALEHSYNSMYVMQDGYSQLNMIRSTMAHEFLHILTPLNLHSEIIGTYNFAEPASSKHIWLYEGVTEWASDIMQLRGGLLTPENYLSEISNKLTINDLFNPDYSLVSMSLDSYNPQGKMQFFNFYNKGAATALLLDIRLLELSGGTRGLREVFLELLDKYGKYKPFSEDEFFNELTAVTYPEIEIFIEDYIKGSEALPCEEYFRKIGYKYILSTPSEDKRSGLGATLIMGHERNYLFVGVKDAFEYGLRNGDILVKGFGKDINRNTISEFVQEAYALIPGDEFYMVVRRDDEEIELSATLYERKDYHLFEEMEDISESQKQLREALLKNLK